MADSSIWVDTDFGFDDLWALLVLRHLGISVTGVSVVFGNAYLQQATQNACSAKQAFGFSWPLFCGADRPLSLPMQTAEAVLGKSGMRTRGLHLPSCTMELEPDQASAAFANWLVASHPRHEVLALGPLTNLAKFYYESPEAFKTIDRITWMGGSAGSGNQTPNAEFNAFADPEAVDVVLSSGVPVDIIDLVLCRTVDFNQSHIPQFNHDNDPAHQLIEDLLGGYLDIALKRGRKAMSIYDPVAALAIADATLFEYTPVTVKVGVVHDKLRGQTAFTPHLADPSANALSRASQSQIRLATAVDNNSARTICMQALQRLAKENRHGN